MIASLRGYDSGMVNLEHWTDQIRPVAEPDDDDGPDSIDEICERQRRAEDYA